MTYTPTQQPDTFWELRVHDIEIDPSLTGLCVGYETKKWRARQFALHMMEWLPEFALTRSELESVGPANMVRLMRDCAKKIYQSEKFKNRGEFGELFLHAAVRTVFKSEPAISKIYYKTSANETVKGFDAVHVVGAPDDMELWIGEAKFYKNIKDAIRDVVAEIEDHTQRDYIKDEFLFIKGKIDDKSEHADQMQKLLSPNTSLDVVFKRACIPVLLTYESACVANHDECSTEYCNEFEDELRLHYSDFVSKLRGISLPKKLTIRLFLLPLHIKDTLLDILDEKLKSHQNQ